MAKKNESFLYLKIFLVIIIAAAGISLVYKTILLVQNSSFKHGSFNMLIISSSVYLIHLDKINNKMYLATIPDPRRLERKSTISQTALLGVFIDGEINVNDKSFRLDPNHFLSIHDAFDFILNKKKYNLENLNGYDLIKIIVYSRFAGKNRVAQTLSWGNSPLFTDRADLLKDQEIFDSKTSLKIDNASEVDGLGSTLGVAFSNLGYNVVAIDTQERQKSKIKSGDLNPQVLRIMDSLKIAFEKIDGNQVADITFIVGPDLLKLR